MSNSLRILTAVTLITAAIGANAADAWIEVAATDRGAWSIKSGSLQFVSNKSDEPIALVIGRFVNANKGVDLEKWYVRGTDCGRGMGKLVTLTLDGEFKYENDFVEDSDDVASVIATVICGISDEIIKKTEGKGV